MSPSLPDTSVGSEFGDINSFAGLSLDAPEESLVMRVLGFEAMSLSLELEREYKDDLCCLEVREECSAFFGVESSDGAVFEEAEDSALEVSVSVGVIGEAEDIDCVL